MRSPHKWAKEIHAIADGIEVQWSWGGDWSGEPNPWIDYVVGIHLSPLNSNAGIIWRIKPPEADKYFWLCEVMEADKHYSTGQPKYIANAGRFKLTYDPYLAAQFIDRELCYQVCVAAHSAEGLFVQPAEHGFSSAGQLQKEESKPPEVAQWRKDMAQALDDGKVVESLFLDGWGKTSTKSEWLLDPERTFNEEYFRIKSEPNPMPDPSPQRRTVERAIKFNPNIYKSLTDEEKWKLWGECEHGLVYDRVMKFADKVLKKANEQ